MSVSAVVPLWSDLMPKVKNVTFAILSGKMQLQSKNILQSHLDKKYCISKLHGFHFKIQMLVKAKTLFLG